VYVVHQHHTESSIGVFGARPAGDVLSDLTRSGNQAPAIAGGQFEPEMVLLVVDCVSG
jgi:hypothetical protein